MHLISNAILRSCTNKNSMVFVWKWAQISTEQNRQPRNKSKYIQSIGFWKRSQESTMGKWQSLQWMVLWKLDCYMQRCKGTTVHTPFTKLNSEWVKNLIISTEVIKILEEKAKGKMSCDLSLCDDILDLMPKTKARRPKQPSETT